MRRGACLQCHKPVEWEGNPHRPFCSERCRLIDLGAWLDEHYVIPGESPQGNVEPAADHEDDSDQRDESEGSAGDGPSGGNRAPGRSARPNRRSSH